MADLNKPVIRSGWGRFWREGVDRMFLGNRGFDSRTGTWNNAGITQGLIGQGANMLFGPIGSIGYGLYARYDTRRGGDGVPFANVSSNPQRGRGIDNTRGTVPTGFVPGGGPTGVAPTGTPGIAPGGGLASLIGGATSGLTGGLAGLVPPAGTPAGGQMPLTPITPEPVAPPPPTTVSTLPGRPTFIGPTNPQALTHMGGARGAFNHGGTVLTGDAARGWMEGQRYTPLTFNFRYGQGDLAS